MAARKPVGVVVALGIEARCLGVSSPAAGTVVATAEGRLLVRTGAGGARAERGARALLDAGAAGLVSFGTAAALSPGLRAGTMLLPERVLSADGRAMRVDAEWRRRLLARLAAAVEVEQAPLAAVDGVLTLARDKARVHRTTGAAGADMESEAVGRVACAAGVPFVVVRAVADGALVDIPACALAALDDDGDVSVRRCLRALLREPAALPSLLASAVGFRAARRALMRAGRISGPRLQMPDAQSE